MDHSPLFPLPDKKSEVGDSLEIIITNGPDDEPIIDTKLSDRTGVTDAVARARRRSLDY